MDAIYAAHIVTSDAVGLGGAEIIVMTSDDDGSSGGDPIASYALPDGDSPAGVLAANGWRSTGNGESEVEVGYTIVEVEPVEWERIVKHVTFAKAQADAEAARQDRAWRAALQGAMHAGGSATRLAAAAGISRERVYQIRDGRR